MPAPRSGTAGPVPSGQVPLQYLIDVVEVGALIRPVVVALPDAIFCEWGQHDDHSAATLPHHLQTEAGMAIESVSLSPHHVTLIITTQRLNPNLCHL